MVRDWVGAAPAESERVDPAYYDIPEMRCVDEVVGIDPKDLVVPPTDLPGLPKPEPPKAVTPPDLPKGSGKSLKLKPENLPHFGDEIMLCEEPSMEPLDKPLDEEDEEANPWTPSLRDRLIEESKSEKHQLSHFPKNMYCLVCQRSRMTGRVHRSRGEPDEDEVPPLHYGHMMRADHIIQGSDLTKGAGGEQACLIFLGEFSGCIGAFSMSNLDTDSNILALQKFAGTKASPRSSCTVKTDCAQELTKAVEHLGWLSEPGNRKRSI